ncbi:MAG: PAS domain-containing sensor histidine kinase [Bacteroidota bacterium]
MIKHDHTEKRKIALRESAVSFLKEQNPKAELRDIEELKHELSVHEIELKMQNVELLDTQTSLSSALSEYAEFFEHSPIGYFILSKDGRIEKVNKKGCELLGIDKSNILGKTFSTFFNGENEQDNLYRHINLVIETGNFHHLDSEIKKNDGSIFSASVKSTLVKNEKNEFKHLLTIVNDISQIKEYEHHIERALQKSNELNKLKTNFITLASHEFRTPLSNVLLSASLVEQYAKMGQEDKMKRHLSRIKASVKDLTFILVKFFTHEKLERGLEIVEKVNFNLPELCDDIIDDIKLLFKTGQHISYKHTGTNFIFEDRKIIIHILENLLSNAIKYSPENKEIELTSKMGENSLLIQVKDFGIGIPLDEQQNLFAIFYRANNAVNIQGAGLGLNITQRLLALINGKISFTSIENEGTTFLVEIPYNKPALNLRAHKK